MDIGFVQKGREMVQYRRAMVWVGVLLLFLTCFSCLALAFVREDTFVQINTQVVPESVPSSPDEPGPPAIPIQTSRIVLDQFVPLTAVTTNIQPILSRPAVSESPTYGVVSASSDGRSLFSVLPGEHVAFAEFLFDSQTKKYNFLTSAYVGGNSSVRLKNRITMVRETTATPLTINVNARNIQCPVLSSDDLRLYVAYEDPTVTDVTGNVAFLPFGGFSGKVQIWVNASGTWIRSEQADLQNPFGAAAADEFGNTVRASIRESTRCIAVKAAFGLVRADGPTLNIFEEDTDSGVYKLVTVLSKQLLSLPGENFARSFDIRDRDTLISFGRTAQDAGLAYFERDARSGVFKFVALIAPPRDAAAGGELFGDTVILGPRNMALVGSPTVDRARGGKVYVMTKNLESIWDVQQAVSDPWQSPGVEFPNRGVFGRFIHVDRDFTLVSVSANRLSASSDHPCAAACAPDCDETCEPDQQSLVCVFDTNAGTMLGPCTLSAIVIFPIDQRNALLVTAVERTQRLFQEQNTPTQFVDPLFGKHMSVITNSDLFSGTKILIGSELNQIISTWVM